MLGRIFGRDLVSAVHAAGLRQSVGLPDGDPGRSEFVLDELSARLYEARQALLSGAALADAPFGGTAIACHHDPVENEDW